MATTATETSSHHNAPALVCIIFMSNVTLSHCTNILYSLQKSTQTSYIQCTMINIFSEWEANNRIWIIQNWRSWNSSVGDSFEGGILTLKIWILSQCVPLCAVSVLFIIREKWRWYYKFWHHQNMLWCFQPLPSKCILHPSPILFIETIYMEHEITIKY